VILAGCWKMKITGEERKKVELLVGQLGN